MFNFTNKKEESGLQLDNQLPDFDSYITEFSNSFNVVNSTYGQEASSELARKILGVVFSINPHVVMSKTGLPTVTQEVFSDELFSNFLLKVSFNFYTRIMLLPGNKERLIDSLTEGLCCNSGESNLVPTEIKERLLVKEDIKQALTDNNWLVCYLFLMLLGGDLAHKNGVVNGQTK